MIVITGSVGSAECEKIVATGNAEYPPILWRDKANPGKLIGVSVELLERAFGELGITVEAKDVGSWARAQQDARKGKTDILAGAFITEERKTYMDYIIPPFMTVPSVIWVMKGQTFPFENWDSLIGLKGGTLINNSFGEKFDTFAKEKLTIEGVPRIEQAFKKMEAGRNRYVVYELYQGLAIAEITGFKDKIEYLPNPVSEEGLYFTFSKKSPCNQDKLKEHLTQKVKAYLEQKTTSTLLEKYLKIWKQQSEASESF
jgi:polar amino acid transport system substrate-binding protein